MSRTRQSAKKKLLSLDDSNFESDQKSVINLQTSSGRNKETVNQTSTSNQSTLNPTIDQQMSTQHSTVNQVLSNRNLLNLNSTDDLTQDKILSLSWSIKGKLIGMLNDYSALLHHQVISDVCRQKVIKETDNLIGDLSSLKVKSDGNPRKKPKLDKSSELFLDLNWNLRNQLVIHLVTNKSYIVSVGDYADQDKMNFIDQNNSLIVQLIGLPVQSNRSDSNDLDHSNEDLNSTTDSSDGNLNFSFNNY